MTGHYTTTTPAGNGRRVEIIVRNPEVNRCIGCDTRIPDQDDVCPTCIGA